MGTTKNYKFPIYDDDWAPDLTTTGAEAQAITAIDTELKKQEKQESDDASRLNQLIQSERTERTDADTTLQSNIDKETQARKDADSKLRTSVETVENEVTSVSADVTGIMGLTYGDDHLNFIEHSGDTYSSPALIEIQHQITDASTAPAWGTVTDKPFETLGDGLSVADGVLSASGGTSVNSIAPLTVTTAPTVGNNCLAIGNESTASIYNSVAIGVKSTASAEGIAIGGLCKAHGECVTVGANATTTGVASVAIGYNGDVSGTSSTAVGPNNVVTGSNSVAIGDGCTVAGSGSVAIGNGSVASEDEIIAVGYDSLTRRIVCVGTPTAGTDAANKAYVDSAVASASGITKDTVWSDIES